jgi:hypothetical protein
VACMALRMYSPRYGAAIDLEPLYIWIPMVYVFAFMLTNHKTGLVVSTPNSRATPSGATRSW